MSDINAMKLAAEWWPLPASELAKKIEELQAAHAREVEGLKAALEKADKYLAEIERGAKAMGGYVSAQNMLGLVGHARVALATSGSEALATPAPQDERSCEACGHGPRKPFEVCPEHPDCFDDPRVPYRYWTPRQGEVKEGKA